MNIKIEREILNEAVNTAIKATAIKTTTDTLNKFKIEANQNTVKITAFDMLNSITVKMNAVIEEEGAALVDARILQAIISKSSNIVNIVTEGNMIKISCGRSVYHLPVTDVKLFPEIPFIRKNECISVEGNIMAEAYKKIVKFVSKNEGRTNGVCVEINNDKITFAATDGYRLIVTNYPTHSTVETKIIIPIGGLKNIIGSIDEDEIVNIYPGKNHLLIATANIETTCKKMDDNFLDYKSVIESCKQYTTDSIKVDKEAFLNVIEASTPVVDDIKKTPVIVVFDKDKIEVTSQSSIGKMKTSCSCDTARDKVKLGANSMFLKDAINSFNTDELNIKIESSINPIYFSGDNTDVIVLPMRIRD